MKDKIVYGWFANERCFYIGIGNSRRMMAKGGRNKYCLNKRSKAEKEGTFVAKILFSKLTKEEAIEIEQNLIQSMGRINLGTGCLTNMTDGGEGMTGYQQTEESRRRKSVSHKGKTHSQDTKNKIRESMKGRKASNESRKKMSEAQKGEKSWLFGKKGKNHAKSQPVQTPLGKFESVKEAANAHKVFSSSMSRTINNPNKPEFHYC